MTRVLFNFPSRYLCTIGHEGVFSLSRWSGQLPTEFHVLRRTWVLTPWCLVRCRVLGFHHLWRAVPGASTTREICNTTAGLLPRLSEPRDPDAATPAGLHSIGLGSSRFARRYYGIRWLFLLLQVLRCFSSLGIASHALRRGIPGHDPGRVAPFGNPRISACLRLPEAYRSLPRPSSPPRAKSSTTRP